MKKGGGVFEWVENFVYDRRVLFGSSCSLLRGYWNRKCYFLREDIIYRSVWWKVFKYLLIGCFYEW